MSSIKCPHCGLVTSSSATTCKRCKKVLPPKSSGAHRPAAARARKSSIRFQSDSPPIAWAITIILLIANAYLAYTASQKSTADDAEALGVAIGGILAWPIVLLIVFGISKKFREKYSLHAVINYGLALNTIVHVFMTLG